MPSPVLLFMLLSAVASGASPTPTTEGGRLVLLLSEFNTAQVVASVEVNGLPLSTLEAPKSSASNGLYVPVPDFLLHKGSNTLTVRYAPRDKSAKAPSLKLGLVRLQSHPPFKIEEQVVQVAASLEGVKEGAPKEVSVSFEVTGAVPKWEWTQGAVVVKGDASLQKLKVAYRAFATQLAAHAKLGSLFRDQESSAKRAGLARDPEVASLEKWAAHPKLRIDLREDSARMETLGEGRLVRLRWRDISPFTFKGGKYDAQPDQLGPVAIAYDLWFRLEKGEFVPAAAWQTSNDPGTL